jgi:dihydrofolate reductase
MDGVGKIVTLIAAMGVNRAIGLGGVMPWHLPGELKHFKQTTMGKAIVMGRKTWESIGRVLPGRQNIVVTRNRDYLAAGCDVVSSLEQALVVAESDEAMIIGGGELYRQALPLAKKMILTRVDCEPEADTWFPEWEKSEWRIISSRSEPAYERNQYTYQVEDWEKV